jgi:hypothetical protein
MSHVVYHCANAIEKINRMFFAISLSLSLSLDAIGRIQTLDLRIIYPVFYHCAATGGQTKTCFDLPSQKDEF